MLMKFLPTCIQCQLRLTTAHAIFARNKRRRAKKRTPSTVRYCDDGGTATKRTRDGVYDNDIMWRHGRAACLARNNLLPGVAAWLRTI